MYKRWEPKKNPLTIRGFIKWLKKAKAWQLLLLLLLCGFITATFLRLNNVGMIKYRDAVLQADKNLNDTVTKQKLTELQQYVSSHMNSSLGKGIILQHTYQRDYDKAINTAANGHNQNSDVYQKASIECRSRFQGGTASFRNDYVTCVANTVANLPQNQQTASVPSLENYRYNFASPLISPDFAGIFTIAFVLLMMFILLRWILLFTLRLVVKRRAKVI